MSHLPVSSPVDRFGAEADAKHNFAVVGKGNGHGLWTWLWAVEHMLGPWAMTVAMVGHGQGL